MAFGWFKRWLLKYKPDTTSENIRVILSLLEPDKSAQVLDLGCFDGEITLRIGQRIGTSKLYGVDVVDKWVERCKGKGIEAYCADLNKPLPLNNESFDVIHACSVLEHLHHTDLFLQEIRRLLKKGGYAIVSVPNLASWPNIACLFLGWMPFTAAMSDEVIVGNPLHRRYMKRPEETPAPYHRRIPTYRALKELFKFYGFAVGNIVGVGYYPFPIAISRFLSRIDARHSGILIIKVRKS